MTNPMQPDYSPGKYEQRGANVGAIVDRKNAAYGDSFHRSWEILAILFPSVDKEILKKILAIVRIVDKCFRYATDKDAFGEDPCGDLAGYGILMMKDDADEADAAKKEFNVYK